MKWGLCFNCFDKSHTSKECPKPKNSKSDKRPTHVSTCAVSSAAPLSMQLSHEPGTKDSRSSSDCADYDKSQEHNSAQNTFESGNQYIDADEFYVRSYIDIANEGLRQQTALIDGGSEICCISEALIQHLNVPVVKQLYLFGLSKQSDLVNVIRLHIKPVAGKKHVINVASSVRVWFAVVPCLHEAVTLTLNVVSLLQNVAGYNVLDLPIRVNVDDNDNTVDMTEPDTAASTVKKISVDTVIHDAHETSDNSSATREQPDDRITTQTQINTSVTVAESHTADNTDEEFGTEQFFNTENPNCELNDTTADHNTLVSKQNECPLLCKYWKLAKHGRNGFFVDNGLLYHRDTILGHRVKQLCLPEKRIPIILEIRHDAPFAGHMAVKSTCHRIKLSFWFPKINDNIKTHCTSCTIC